jgi:hypothetical protein
MSYHMFSFVLATPAFGRISRDASIQIPGHSTSGEDSEASPVTMNSEGQPTIIHPTVHEVLILATA